MLPVTDAFRFDDGDCDVVYGRGAVDGLGDLLAERGLERALLVCGAHVGANDHLMGRVRAGLGDRLAGVFDETTPQKLAATAYDAIDAMREVEADALIGVGGGSSLDVARQTSVFAADGRRLDDLVAAAREGRVEAPDCEAALPVFVVPTTFAGADVSAGGTIELLPAAESPTGQPVRVSGSVTPRAVVHDPDLFETTPTGALAGSAMNGFNKAVETVYAPGASAVSDAAAVHSLRLLSDAFPRLPAPDATERAVQGVLLAQYRRRVSVVHAVGHGFARRYPVQQGVIHAVVVPHVLRYVLDNADARSGLLAEGLGVEDETEAIVDAVAAVRDDLDLPARLRDVDPIERDDLPAIARFVVDDGPMERAPPGLDATADDVERVLEAAW